MRTYTHLVKGIDPAIDVFSGTVETDVVSMKNHEVIEFYIHKGVGVTGTSTITVESCDNTTPSNTTAIPFRYQEILNGDTHGEMIEVGAGGFVTSAGSSQLYKISIDAQALAESEREFVRLVAVEVVDSPVAGGIMIALIGPRYDQAIQQTAIA